MNFKKLTDRFTKTLRARQENRDQQFAMEQALGQVQAERMLTNHERVLAQRYEKLQELHDVTIPTLIRHRRETVEKLSKEPNRKDYIQLLRELDSQISVRVQEAYSIAGRIAR